MATVPCAPMRCRFVVLLSVMACYIDSSWAECKILQKPECSQTSACVWKQAACRKGFAPKSKKELDGAKRACIFGEHAVGDCSSRSHGPIGAWDVSAVTDMSRMFSDEPYARAFNQDLSKWDVSAVTDMSRMFWRASAFNQDLSKWDVSAVTDMEYMFSDARSFNQDLSKWDVSAVTTMREMFRHALAFNQDLSKWDVSAVTNMWSMFRHASAFNQDLSKWDVSAVTTMRDMFSDTLAFNQDLSKWEVSAVTDMRSMFRDATSFFQTLCSVAWVTSTANKKYMFAESPGSICTSWIIPLVILISVGIIAAVIAIVCVNRKKIKAWRERFLRHGHTEQYQREVRREWVRALVKYSGSRRPPITVCRDPGLSQMFAFFEQRPGLCRSVGGRVVWFYSPTTADRLILHDAKDTQVQPAL